MSASFGFVAGVATVMVLGRWTPVTAGIAISLAALGILGIVVLDETSAGQRALRVTTGLGVALTAGPLAVILSVRPDGAPLRWMELSLLPDAVLGIAAFVAFARRPRLAFAALLILATRGAWTIVREVFSPASAESTITIVYLAGGRLVSAMGGACWIVAAWHGRRLRAGRPVVTAAMHLAVLLMLPACAAPADRAYTPSVSDDSAVYVTLIAPDTQGGRGRAVAKPIDLRRMTDGAQVGGALARRAPGFDSTLVTALHRTAPDGRGPGVALRSRPTLLWSKPRNSSMARATPSGKTVTEMERDETEPEWISLRYSAVQYSSDGQWAVVLEDRFCGPLCGAERYVVFRRATGGWRVVTELVTVVS